MLKLEYAPWVDNPDPPDRMDAAAIAKLVDGMAKLAPDLVKPLAREFNPDQPRDDHGQWTGDGGGDTSSSTPHGVKASGLQAADKLKAEWFAKSPVTSVDHLMAVGAEAQDQLVKVSTEIEGKLEIPFVNPGVKSRARTEEKIARGRTPQSITDVVRGGFKVDHPKQADAVVKELAKKFEVADEGWQITPAGYADRKVMVKFSSGVVGEIQIWQPALLHAKEVEGGHALYVQWGRVKAGSVEAVRLEGEMQRLYGAARSHLPPEWDAVLGKAGS
jgi:hypothetical protein